MQNMIEHAQHVLIRPCKLLTGRQFSKHCFTHEYEKKPDSCATNMDPNVGFEPDDLPGTAAQDPD